MSLSHSRAFIPLCQALFLAAAIAMPAHVLAQAKKVTVTMGNPGDHWLDAMQFIHVGRGQRGRHFGYEVTYIVPGIGEKVLFWPRSKIDLDGSAPRKYRQQFIQLEQGRLYLPDRITAESLPKVYRAILILEEDYTKDARGGKAAAEAFTTVVGLAGALPAPTASVASRLSTTGTSTRVAAKPATAKPAATSKPATSKPATSKPATAKPATAKPATAKPAPAAKGRGRLPDDALEHLSPQMRKSVRSWETRLAEHRQKLEAYRKNPDAFDNKGFLKNARTPEIRQQIISSRIHHLETEIRNFERQIADALTRGRNQ